VASSDTNDQISGTCALALTGTGATMCTAAVTPPHVNTATHAITASYPADDVHSASDNSSQSDGKNVLTVIKGTPVIAWRTLVPITYGTALSPTQLDASSPLTGSFAYTPAAGTVLAAGTQTLSVTFTPTDTADYTTATQTVQLTVNQAPLTITANNKTKAYGAPLSILDASYSGFVNGEGASVLSGTLSCTTTATQASHVAGSPYTPLPVRGKLQATTTSPTPQAQRSLAFAFTRSAARLVFRQTPHRCPCSGPGCCRPLQVQLLRAYGSQARLSLP
jgi:hypothetical protein